MKDRMIFLDFSLVSLDATNLQPNVPSVDDFENVLKLLEWSQILSPTAEDFIQFP